MKQFIRELSVDQQVNSPFYVRNSSLLKFNSKPGRYLTLVLADRTGEMEAKVWQDAEEFSELAVPGRIIYVTGSVVKFQENLQLRVDSMRPAIEDEVDYSHYIGECSRPLPEMKEELLQWLNQFREPAWFELGQVFIKSDIFPIFCEAPAAQTYHHNYRGGLLEHSLGVAAICRKLSEIHPEIDRELVTLGALLHDVGKSREMGFTPGIEYSNEGKLLGHIILGTQMVSDLTRQVMQMDEGRRNQLLHIIASHHGEYKWQSPKKPMFLEAKVIFLADMMDAEIWKFKSAVPRQEGGNWSDFMKIIGSQVYFPNDGRPSADNERDRMSD